MLNSYLTGVTNGYFKKENVLFWWKHIKIQMHWFCTFKHMPKHVCYNWCYMKFCQWSDKYTTCTNAGVSPVLSQTKILYNSPSCIFKLTSVSTSNKISIFEKLFEEMLILKDVVYSGFEFSKSGMFKSSTTM